MKIEYIITSRAGMTPFARCATLRQAERDARMARRIGLDGEIIRYVDGQKDHRYEDNQ